MADQKDNLKDFEKSLQHLEKIVAQMESGELGLEDAIARAQRATRNYAKRQATWLRTQLPQAQPGTEISIEQYSESLTANIFSKVRRFLLTG